MSKTKGINKKVILGAVIIVAVAVMLLIGFSTHSSDVSKYLADGQSITYTLKGSVQD